MRAPAVFGRGIPGVAPLPAPTFDNVFQPNIEGLKRFLRGSGRLLPYNQYQPGQVLQALHGDLSPGPVVRVDSSTNLRTLNGTYANLTHPLSLNYYPISLGNGSFRATDTTPYHVSKKSGWERARDFLETRPTVIVRDGIGNIVAGKVAFCYETSKRHPAIMIDGVGVIDGFFDQYGLDIFPAERIDGHTPTSFLLDESNFLANSQLIQNHIGRDHGAVYVVVRQNGVTRFGVLYKDFDPYNITITLVDQNNNPISGKTHTFKRFDGPILITPREDGILSFVDPLDISTAAVETTLPTPFTINDHEIIIQKGGTLPEKLLRLISEYEHNIAINGVVYTANDRESLVFHNDKIVDERAKNHLYFNQNPVVISFLGEYDDFDRWLEYQARHHQTFTIPLGYMFSSDRRENVNISINSLPHGRLIINGAECTTSLRDPNVMVFPAAISIKNPKTLLNFEKDGPVTVEFPKS